LEKSPPEPGERQRSQRKYDSHANENDDEEIRVRIHSCHDERKETSLDSDLRRETIVSQRFFASLRMTMTIDEAAVFAKASGPNRHVTIT
jgi:hypothetical protein